MSNYLLTGNDREMMFSLFSAASNDNVLISTSEHSFDISNHLKLFTPDAFIICAKEQTTEQLLNIRSVLEDLVKKGIPACVIGTEDDFDIAFSYIGNDNIKKYIDKELSIQAVIDDIKVMVMDSKQALQDQSGDSENSAENHGDSEMPTESDSETQELLPPLNMESSSTSTTSATETKKETNTKLAIKKKILVIDDDPVMLKTIKLYLENDYTVLTSLKGQLALNFLKSKTVDLILLDYEMPEMNGLEVLKRIRGGVLTSSLPVIFLTGVADVERIKMIGQYNIQGYTLKPVNKDKLLETIEKVIHINDEYLIVNDTEKPKPKTINYRSGEIKWKNT